MLIGLLASERISPTPGLRGAVCPCCGSAIIARCGPERAWHFAHKVKSDCDRWKEPETEWHRRWKGLFPQEWREVIAHDAVTGEKHVADIRTAHGLTIEFQHSNIHHEERTARETFHGNMMWVVDGTRLVKDLPRFLEGRKGLHPAWRPGVYLCAVPQETFHAQWIERRVPVFFDFRGGLTEAVHAPIRDMLWCLVPYRVGGYALVVAMATKDFVELASRQAEMLPWRGIAEGVAQWMTPKQPQRRRMSSRELLALGAALNRMEQRSRGGGWPSGRKSRRF